MIRFILKNETFYELNQLRKERFFTIDGDIAALEAALTNGGMGESGFDCTSLVGVEILPEQLNNEKQ